MPLSIASVFGFAVALCVYALRAELRARFDQDVAWANHTVWRFTPDPIPTRKYVVLFYVAAAATLFLVLLLAPNPVVGVIFWVVLVLLPRTLAARAWRKRKEKIDEQLPAAVRQMSSGVGSGLSLAQAMERLGARAPAPIRTEFRIMSNYWKMGADFASTIEEAKRRLALPNFTLFSSALIVNQRMGGNITETLDRLASSLESIAQMQREVHAATSEGRTNIKVLALAPFIMLGLVALMDVDSVVLLLTSNLGHVLLGLALFLTALGTKWAWAIVNADV